MKMNVSGRVLSRRRLLQGAGVGIALPYLEAMSRTTAVASAPGKPPVRLGFFYVPNGVHMDAWRPEHSGAMDKLPPILAPLAAHGVQDRVQVLSNLKADHCIGKSASHEPAGGGFLVGHKCEHSEDPKVGGVSIDQVAAREIGLTTPVDSLALGIDPGHRGDHGFSGTYLSHISWKSKTTPVALELNPRELYSRLFRDQAPRRPDWSAAEQGDIAGTPIDPVESSILDLVREDTQSLQKQLGFADRRKLQEYLEGLRSIERRIQLAQRDSRSHHQDAFTDDAINFALHDGEREEDLPELIIPDGRGIPEVYGDHVQLMLDILTLAFQTDTTRVSSFLFSFEKSGRSYPQIGAPGSHHSTSHHQDLAENHRQLTAINTHHMDLFARMLQRMSTIDEGGSTLLDNVVFLYGSGISDGNRHNHDDLPVLVAGGGGGAIPGGLRHHVFDQPTPICNLYLEMLARAGVQRSQFGDSTGSTDVLGA